jgi:hypothetical protein
VFTNEIVCGLVSNAEPGYYEDGNFGVRIENVLIVNEAEAKYNYGEKGYLAFEHITWVSNNLFLVSQAVVTVAMCGVFTSMDGHVITSAILFSV